MKLIVIAILAVFGAIEFFPVLMSNYAPLSGGPVHGVVSDAKSNEPLAGAIIIVHWIGHLSGSHGPRYPCYYIALARSDENGVFDVPKWKLSRDDGPRWYRGMTTDNIEEPIETLAYKPGYFLERSPVTSAVNKDVSLKMEPFVGSVQKRLGYLVSPFGRHVMCDADDKALIPLYQAMYDEAKASATTAEELKTANYLLVALETAQYGNEEALTRSGARELDRIKSLKK